jgi:hypothetical protein
LQAGYNKKCQEKQDQMLHELYLIDTRTET